MVGISRVGSIKLWWYHVMLISVGDGSIRWWWYHVLVSGGGVT